MILSIDWQFALVVVLGVVAVTALIKGRRSRIKTTPTSVEIETE